MNGPLVFLKEIEMLILQQVDFILNDAADGALGSSAEWENLLDNYNESRPQILKRAATVLEQGFGEGGLPDEVRKSLAAISDLARPALAHVELQFAETIRRDPALSRRVELISNYLSKLHALGQQGIDSASDLVVDPVWEDETKPEFVVPFTA